jgi:hypothetical protein
MKINWFRKETATRYAVPLRATIAKGGRLGLSSSLAMLFPEWTACVELGRTEEPSGILIHALMEGYDAAHPAAFKLCRKRRNKAACGDVSALAFCRAEEIDTSETRTYPAVWYPALDMALVLMAGEAPTEAELQVAMGIGEPEPAAELPPAPSADVQAMQEEFAPAPAAESQPAESPYGDADRVLYMTVREMAEELGVNVQKAQNLLNYHTAEFVTVKPYSRRYVLRRSVAAYKAKREPKLEPAPGKPKKRLPRSYGEIVAGSYGVMEDCLGCCNRVGSKCLAFGDPGRAEKDRTGICRWWCRPYVEGRVA